MQATALSRGFWGFTMRIGAYTKLAFYGNHIVYNTSLAGQIDSIPQQQSRLRLQCGVLAAAGSRCSLFGVLHLHAGC